MLQKRLQDQANSRKNCCRNKENHVATKQSEFTTKGNTISVVTKIISVVTKKNMKEVNSLSRQEAEELHKKNGDKEILVAT